MFKENQMGMPEIRRDIIVGEKSFSEKGYASFLERASMTLDKLRKEIQLEKIRNILTTDDVKRIVGSKLNEFENLLVESKHRDSNRSDSFIEFKDEIIARKRAFEESIRKLEKECGFEIRGFIVEKAVVKTKDVDHGLPEIQEEFEEAEVVVMPEDFVEEKRQEYLDALNIDKLKYNHEDDPRTKEYYGIIFENTKQQKLDEIDKYINKTTEDGIIDLHEFDDKMQVVYALRGEIASLNKDSVEKADEAKAA